MPAVLSGDVTKVDSIVERFDKTTPSQSSDDRGVKDSPNILDSASKTPLSSAEEELVPPGRPEEGGAVKCGERSELSDEEDCRKKPPVKKVKKMPGWEDSPGSERDGQAGKNKDKTSPSPSRQRKSGLLTSLTSAEVGSKVDFDAEVPLLGVESGSHDSNRMDASVGSGENVLGMELFYELSLQNSNILHVCGQFRAFCEDRGPRESQLCGWGGDMCSIATMS